MAERKNAVKKKTEGEKSTVKSARGARRQNRAKALISILNAGDDVSVTCYPTEDELIEAVSFEVK